MRYLYFHGFASGPASRKARFFSEQFESIGKKLETPDLTPTPAEGGFEALTLTGQLGFIERLLGEDACVLMGSSMGGYLAALYAAQHPSVERIILLAPAFCMARQWRENFGRQRMSEWQERGHFEVHHYATGEPARIGYGLISDAEMYPDYPKVTVPSLVFHGIHDPIVPVAFAREFVQRSEGAELVEFDSAHELTDCMDAMWKRTRTFLQL